MQQSEVQEYLNTVQLRTELSDHEKQQVLDLIPMPGLALLLGLLLGDRQGLYAQFRNLRSEGDEGARRLGVLQGKIDGVERASLTLLECAIAPAETKE